MKHLVLFPALVSLCWFAAEGHAGTAVATGFLEGRLKVHVSGGAELADAGKSKAASVDYAEYPMVVLRKDNREEITQVTADKNGHYRIPLPPGHYLLELKGRSRKRIQAEQHSFTVVSRQTVRVDMELLPDLSVSGAPR